MITSQLIGGGPGPDYQIKKSKLEPGMRELTAVLLVPTFLPTLRMEVSSNWFKLNDPEHLVFHTKRMLERGREVQELRQAVIDACSAQQYRDADLRVLRAKLAQLEAMLPAQSKVIQLPYENSASGFDLLSDGATALVPELSGYEGVDTVKPPTGTSTTPTDIFVYGKYIDLLDTKVIVGGAYVPPTPPNVNPTTGGYEILSREVVHVQIPSTAQPTLTIDDKTYLEVYLATPTGISNRVLVPYQAAAPAPLVAYDLNSKDVSSTELDIFYQWTKDAAGNWTLIATDDPGTVDKKPLKITWDASTGMAPKALQATFNATVNGYIVNFSLPANSGTKDDYAVDRQVMTVCLLNLLQNAVTAPAPLPDPVSVTVSVQPYIPLDNMGYRVLSSAKPLKTPLTVRLIPKLGSKNVLQDVVCPPPPAAPKPDPGAKSSALQRPNGPMNEPIRPVSLRDAESSTLRGTQEPGGFPLGGFQVPNPPTLPPNLTGGVPPLPASPIPNAAAIGATLQASNTKIVPSQADIQTQIRALAPAPSIFVNPSPVVVVAPSPVPPTKSKSRLSRIFHRNERDRAAPAQAPR